MDEFKDKILGNVRRISRKFSTRRKGSNNGASIKEGQKPAGSKLSRSHSARLSSEKPERRTRPSSAQVQNGRRKNSKSDDYENFFMQTVLAIQSGHVSGLKRVLQLNKLSTGFNVNSYDKYGRTIACHFAAKCPRKSINAMIEIMIDEGVDLDLGTRSEGLTPLMIAAQHEDCDVSIIALLSHGCDPNIQDYNGDSVFHWLESSNSERDCNLFETRRDEARNNLLLYGARLDLINSRGKTARDIITQRNKKYEDEGIDINSVNSEDVSSLNSPWGEPDKDDRDEFESISDEILMEYNYRAYGKYEELDFYMEKIIEIQEQLSLAN